MADPAGVCIGFNDAWNVAAPALTRIDTLGGCRLREWSIDRGRPDVFAKTGTGTAAVSIIDRAGLFDPTNLTSPYAGQIRTGLQATIALPNPVNDTWHLRFRGYVAAWRYRLAQTRQYMELQLELVDGFAMLARAELRVGVDGTLPLPHAVGPGNVGYAETAGSVDERIFQILGDVGWPPELAVPAVDIFSGNVRVGPKGYPPGSAALDALFDAADAEFVGVANLFVARDGHLRFRGRQARFRPDVAEYGIQRRTCGDPSATAADAAVVPIAELEWTLEDAQIVNSCIATPQGVGSGTGWRWLDPDIHDVDGQLVEDAASQLLHGTQSLTFDNLQTIEGLATGNDALQETRLMARYYVENYAFDAPGISRLVFKSKLPGHRLGPALWQHLCNSEISDLLTIKSAHPGGGGFNHEFYVEGIHETCRPGAPGVPIVEQSLDVSPREHWTTNPFDADPDPVAA